METLSAKKAGHAEVEEVGEGDEQRRQVGKRIEKNGRASGRRRQVGGRQGGERRLTVGRAEKLLSVCP